MTQTVYRSRSRRRSYTWGYYVKSVIIGLFIFACIATAYRYAWQAIALLPSLPAPAQVAPTAVVARPTAPPVIRPAIIQPGAPPAAEGQPTPLPLVAPATNEAPAVNIAPATISDDRREQLNSVDTPSQCVNCQPAAPVEQQPVMSGKYESGVVEATVAPVLVVQPAKELNRRQLTFDGKGSSQK